MATYQGPNVQVRQVFEVTPAAVAIEDLPSAVVGTPYDVFAKENLATFDGIASANASGDQAVAFVLNNTNDKVIYSASQGERIYNFYPPTFYSRDVQTSIDYDYTPVAAPTSSGIVVKYTDTFVTNSITSTKAVMPFFVKTFVSQNATVDGLNLKKINCPEGQFIDAKIQPGQQVVGTNSTKFVLGIVASVESNTVLYLKADCANAGPFTALYIGCNQVVQADVNSAIFVTTTPAFIYDSDTNFTRLGVKRGDLIKTTSSGFATEITHASVVNVITDNMIEIFTGTATSANYTTTAAYTLADFYSAATTSTATFTVSIYEYETLRFVGFTEKYSSAAVSSLSVTTNSVTFGQALDLSVGDTIQLKTASGRTKSYVIIAKNVNNLTYYLDAVVSETPSNDLVYAWHSALPQNVISSYILGDYRAVLVDNLHVTFKSSDNELTGTNGVFGESSVYNELAFMCSIVAGSNGGRVMYAYGVDSTASIADEYAEALEALKYFDVYSHAFGTDDPGVNATIPAYVDEQSDPYEGHERIGVLAYHEDDVYKLAQATISTISTTGLIAITSGTVNLQTIGLGIGDTVKFYNATDAVWETVTVQASPQSSTQVDTDWSHTAITVSGTVYFYAGTKSKQANRVASLAVGNRRVSIIWPGKFWADTQATSNLAALTNVELPAYYLSALVCGMDGGKQVSQSFTRYVTGVPGLSNIQLKTSSYFRKADLDIIGGGGIDILVQSNAISNTIYSRHDLTTDMTGVETRERSITKQADSAAKTMRSSVDPYVGKYNITPNLLKFVDQVLTAVRNVIIKKGVLYDLQILSVKRDPDIADKINVLVKATVFVAGNYYDITMTVVSR